MSKVMVILDEPTCCGYCKLSGGYDSYCRVTLAALERDKYKSRPEWCPLILVPKENVPRMDTIEYLKSKNVK